jgi:hypothetical protein
LALPPAGVLAHLAPRASALFVPHEQLADNRWELIALAAFGFGVQGIVRRRSSLVCPAPHDDCNRVNAVCDVTHATRRLP